MIIFKALGAAFKAFCAELHSSNQQNFLPPSPNSQLSIPNDPRIRNVNHMTSRRSEALELLAALQREARFIDFIKDDLSESICSQDTLFEVVKMVHDRCAETCEKIFSIRPLSEEINGEPSDSRSEDSTQEDVTTEGSRLHTNKRVIHHGWRATKCDLPVWQGDKRDELVLASCEYETLGMIKTLPKTTA